LKHTWGSITRDIDNGAGAKPYDILIDGGGLTLKEIYNWLQYQLLQATDIDAGVGEEIGKLVANLVSYTGTMITNTGVFVENFAAADANSITYTDSNGASQSPPLTVPVAIASSAGSDASGASVAVYVLDGAYNATTYTPANITSTLLDGTLGAAGTASTSIVYTANLNCLVRIRKPGLKPAELGVTLTNAGLNATLVNEDDNIYQASV
jgi:hypothetical protein